MDNIGDEYQNYWETNMFYQADELDSWVDETTMSAGYYDDSSSPDGGANSSKNIVSERNRRRKLNERLFALRSVVPTISKMDKASIIKDAIDYIQQLQEEEKRIQKEIQELEDESVVGQWEHQMKNVAAAAGAAGSALDVQEDEEEGELPLYRRLRSNKKKKKTDYYDNSATAAGRSKSLHYSPIEVLELKVTYMGEKTLVVSLTCSNKRRDTMVKLCEVFESLNLKTIAANITAISGRHLLNTLFIEAEEEEKEQLKVQIETAIAALNNQPASPMSM